jgi:hypothetical protein
MGMASAKYAALDQWVTMVRLKFAEQTHRMERAIRVMSMQNRSRSSLATFLTPSTFFTTLSTVETSSAKDTRCVTMSVDRAVDMDITDS